MGLWSLGIGIPVKNRSFKSGTYTEDQLGSAYSSGLTMAVNSDNRNLFQADDYIVVGPSNNASHIGRTEPVKITGVGSNYINIANALTYDYAASDYITGVGNRIAAGWIVDNTYNAGIRLLGFDTDGKNHNSAQIFRGIGTPVEVGTDIAFRLRQTIDANIFLPSTVYRVGFYYKFILNALDPKLICVVYDGISDFVAGVTVTTTNVPTYTLFTKVATSNSTAGSPSGVIDVIIYITAGLVEEYDSTVYVDQIFLEHATGTDDAANGVYTFTEYPEFGSIQWGRMDTFKKSQLRNLASKVYNVSGVHGKNYLHKIKAQFDNVSSAFYDNLLVLLNYQLDGSFLVLHHDILGLPPTSYGLMTLSGYRNNMFDRSKISFTFTFEETM